MSRIKMQSDGKRPRFFPESGADEMVSMMLELMSEVWVLKERLYVLEQVATEQGLDLANGIENWQPDAQQIEERAAARAEFIASVTRSINANNVPGLHLRRSLDAAHASEDDTALTNDDVTNEPIVRAV